MTSPFHRLDCSGTKIFKQENCFKRLASPRASLTAGVCALALALTTGAAFAEETVSLSSLDLSAMQQEWGSPQINKSIDGHSLSIGGRKFEAGVGTHASSSLRVKLDGHAEKFTAWVGVDDEEKGHASTITFSILGDGKKLWQSGVMRAGDVAKQVDVDLKGIKTLLLLVGDAEDGISYDHADWADANFVMTEGRPETAAAVVEPAVVLTPAPGSQPEIHGAKIYGCRPGHQFIYIIAATGDRPMKFSAKGLPKGLKLDPATGVITGAVAKRGEYAITFTAKNAAGTSQRKFKIVCGDQIALTPPMGWNSWNCFASSVTEDKIKAAANAMVSSGLINHGWSYINIDDFWEVHRDSKDPTLQGPQRSPDGRVLPNPRFPDMPGLTEFIHAKGLKAGLYSSPGPWTCGGCVASWQHEIQDAKQYGDWGFDYLKYDWCSYGDVVKGEGVPYDQKPYQVMRAALDQVPRDIVFSFCQYGMGDVWKWGAETGGNSWRTTGDITDTWMSMSGIGFSQNGHEKYAAPGHWNDPDMLVVGNVGWGSNLHPTRLSPNEQYTHISLWCLLSAPLLIGCDMTQLNDFTLSLLSNDEVLALDQDSLGRQASRVAKGDSTEVWVKDLEDGSKAVGLFNRSEDDTTVTANWSDLGIGGKQTVRDLWRQKDLGKFESKFEAAVPRHGVVLVRIIP
ncbi:MAG TPA: NPCBM/NEW2 domain-containing protein [Verrucomicrobiae bacterium]|jgi:alpha-galactosidase|nr:NPCBM/NEW2 domain-containing protein [Verrucomicrobiae bacterium]